MSLLRKITNGVLVLLFFCVIGGMIAWGIISHNENEREREARRAGEKLVQQDMESHHDDSNLGFIKGCHGPSWKCSLRLDPAVIPLHYEIYINPNIQTGLFEGVVKIKVNITENVEHIRLHIKDLDILSTVVRVNNEEVNNITAFLYGDNEFWVIDHTTSNKMFQKGDYTLEIKFQGDMTKKIVGVYRAAYYDKNSNETRYVVSTKFQPTDARRAFPCFDEPGFKSTFSLRVVRPRNLTCISNMLIHSEELNTPQPGYTTVFFEKSVPMVTYLVAFAIGDFESRNATTSRGLPVRVYATRPLAPNVEYAASIAPKMVEFYEDYFKVKYPLPKLDIIGIPEFISGAMEHWGMISFRESNLVYTPGVSSAYNKKRVAAVISHEIAHMWFGNLMTLKWWNDLWLNEGFASYMEYKGVNHVHPEWKINWQFLADDFADTLRLDARMSSHPIVQAVSHPNQITELFDAISYSKGATIIRMLEDFMGVEAFRNGVSTFLTEFSFKNAVTQDLWDSLQKEATENVNISLIMSTWTTQMGYPVVTPTQLNSTKIRFSQERFYENRGAGQELSKNIIQQVPMMKKIPPSPFNYMWEIPLKIEYGTLDGNKGSKVFWMNHKTSEGKNGFEVDLGTKYDWFKLNPGYFGLYRVNYNETVIRKIQGDLLQHWTVPDKCGLMRDLFSLANGNYNEDFSLALEFAQILKGKTEFLLWDCADGHLRKIGKLLRKTSPDVYPTYQRYMQALVEKAYDSLEWNDTEDEDLMKRLIKPKIISLACEFELQKCRQQASELLNASLESSDNVLGGFRDVVYKWGMHQADNATWQQVWKRYKNEQDPQERVRLLRGLASIQNADLIQQLLELSQDDKIVKKQDYFGALKYIGQNPIGNPIVWNFYKSEFKRLSEKFGIDNKYFGRVIQDLTTEFSTEEELKEVFDLFEKYPNGGAGTNARKYAVENIINNIHWRSTHSPKVEGWLKNF